MKVSQSLSALVALAATVTATPIGQSDAGSILTRGGPASGCYPAASPRCCVPTVCQCADGKIYQFNTDNQNGGGNGCDPPWGYITENLSRFPGYCC